MKFEIYKPLPFEMYKPKCVAIVLDVAPRPAKNGQLGYNYIKTGIIEGLRTLQSDDFVYVYRTAGDLAMGKTVSESVAVINDWHHQKLNVAVAIEECLLLVGQYAHSDKALFYITNNYKSMYDGLVQEAVRADVESGSECQVYFYGIGPGYSQTLKFVGESVSPYFNFRHMDDYPEFITVFPMDFAII